MDAAKQGEKIINKALKLIGFLSSLAIHIIKNMIAPGAKEETAVFALSQKERDEDNKLLSLPPLAMAPMTQMIHRENIQEKTRKDLCVARLLFATNSPIPMLSVKTKEKIDISII